MCSAEYFHPPTLAGWIPSILLTRLVTLPFTCPPGAAALTRLTVKLSNGRFVIYIPLVIVIIAAIVIIVVAGSGCAPIAVIEVAAV